MVWSMGESFQFEYGKKLTKIKEELSKREVDVRNLLTNIEKIKVEALKKTEEMKYSAEHDIEKIEQDIIKSIGLDADAKARIASEITALKSEIEKRHTELRKIILEKATLS